MRAPATPRRRWPIILIAVVLAALAGYGIYAVSQANTGKPTATPTSSPTATPSASTGGAVPTGCLAGGGLDAATLLATQRAATHDRTGAVEFAAALMRWAYRYPYPTSSDSAQVAGAVISSAAPASFRDLPGFFAGSPNLSGGLVDNNVEYRLSTVPGVWYLDASGVDQMTVSVGEAFVINGQLSSQLRASTTVVLRWEGGAWKADQLSGTHTTEELFQIGTQFIGGC